MSTPHNQANEGSIAKTVLMPGDPLRAKLIADTFLEDAVLVNSVRNIFAYTGKYKGVTISVMASGMGMPSMGIYSYELYTSYGVESIIRIGSAGAYSDQLELLDIMLADRVYSESSFGSTQNGDTSSERFPSDMLNEKIITAAKKMETKMVVGSIHSSDVFYQEKTARGYKEVLAEEKCLCVEMESFALFHNAKVLGKNAACLVTISDSFVTADKISAEDRQNSFMKMIELALEAAITI